MIAAAVGCNGADEGNLSKTIGPHGPHGGHKAVMSDSSVFEIEFTLDQRRQRMVLYSLEAGGSHPYPLAVDSLRGQFETAGQSIDVTFAADPRPDDPQGSASRFVLDLDELPQQLVVADRFVLKLFFEADGETITASIPHRNDHAHEYHHD